MDDQKLLECFSVDPERALELLMDKYIKLVCSVVTRSLIPPFSVEDVDECVSDVFMRFYNSVSSIDLSRGSIRSYLCMIAKNRAVDFRRSNPYSLIPSSLDDTLTSSDELEFCTEDMIDSREKRQMLANAIGSLAELDRQIIFRKYYCLEKSKDIAESLDISPNAVDIRAHKALKKLKNILGGDFLYE